MQVKFKTFSGMFKSWETLFQEAVDFANELLPEQIINISHSCDQTEGVVTVWYWSADDEYNEEEESIEEYPRFGDDEL